MKVNAGLDEVADDQAALSQQQREEAEAQIMADALMIERAECSVIWHAEAKGEVIDFRADTSPQALLGVRLVTGPPLMLGTTVGHSYEIVLPWKR